MTTGDRMDETTKGGHEGVSVPTTAAVEETLLLTSAPPTKALFTEDPPQLADGPALKKRKVAAPVIVNDAISDKLEFLFHTSLF